MWCGSLGRISAAKHLIKLTSDEFPPVHSQGYRKEPRARDFETTAIEKMLKRGAIEPVETEWTAPRVFASKKIGSLRFCVDSRKLSPVSVRDS